MLDRLLADWPLKLLSVGLAFVIWVSITGEKRIPVNFDIALDPQLQEGHIFSQPPPAQVTVRLVGPESVVRRLDPLAMAVRLDLTETPLGARDVQLIEAQLVGRPQRVDVEFFDPERIFLVVDERQRRQLPIRPNLTGDPVPGFHVYRTRVIPDTVLVEGPADSLGSLTHIGTDPITLENRTRRFEETVNAVPDRPHVRLVDPQPLQVRVIVDAAPVERIFDAVPVAASTPLYDVALRPETVQVTVSGPAALLERLTDTQIRLTADLGEMTPEAGARRVALRWDLDLPPEQLQRVSVGTLKPQQVTARLTERTP